MTDVRVQKLRSVASVGGATCPMCRARLPGDAPQGLCPACLLRQGLDTEAPAPPHGQPTAPGATLEGSVPAPGAVTSAGADTTASLIPRISGPSPDPTA